MKRGSLFFIAFISAIITIISLNVVLGRSGFYNERYSFYNRYHHCYNNYDQRYRDDKNHHNQQQQNPDSLNRNY